MSNTYIIELLKEMKENCLKGNIYDDQKRNDKAEALNFAIFLVERSEKSTS